MNSQTPESSRKLPSPLSQAELLPGIRVIPISLFLCLTQVVTTIYSENIYRTFMTSSMISVMAFACLAILVLAINPLLSLAPFMRRLNRAELVCIYGALIMTAGLSTFGMSNHLVPLIHAPWNPEWNTEQRGWTEALTHETEPILNKRLFLQDVEAIHDFRQGVPVLEPPDGADWTEKTSYLAEVFWTIRWDLWAQPAAYWLIFFAAFFGLFYSLSYVVLGYWSDREKLIFPLAKLAEYFLPSKESGRLIPPIFRNPVFYFGVGITAFIMSWNGAVAAGWIFSGFKIPMGLGWSDFGSLVERTFLAPLGNEPDGTPAGSLSLTFGFLAIGIGFLLPVHVTFSAWFYFLFGQFLILAAVWMGFGEHFRDFGGTNAMNASQGAGALLFFSLVSLTKCVMEYVRLVKGKILRDRLLIMLPVTLMIFFQLVLVGWLLWMGIPVLWGAVFILFGTVLSLGFMRIVAEAGIYYFSTSLHFFGFAGTFGLRSIIPPEVMARLAPVHSMLFFDLKAFMAPNFLTAAKLQKDNITDRKWIFHTNAIVCLLVCMVAATVVTIFLAHERGAQQMYGWFYSGMPQRVVDMAQGMLDTQPTLRPVNATWYFIGALWVAISLWLRQRFFWFPHPIGYVLLAIGLMTNLWFSFLIGWIFKAGVVRYGGKRTYDQILPFFLGLIAGNLLTAFAWAILGLILGFESGLLPG